MSGHEDLAQLIDFLQRVLIEGERIIEAKQRVIDELKAELQRQSVQAVSK